MMNSGVILVLGATGKTGARVARLLEGRGVQARRASRSSDNVTFDWDEASTWDAALKGVDRVYLVGPIVQTNIIGQVSAFLDAAESAGVGHVTYLSAHDVTASPTATGQRRVELDLEGRTRLTSTILRPAWFMQNFSETFLRPVGGQIIVPAGDGAEAFVDVEDIAAVAAETLLDPAAHNGRVYAITGPEALTVAQAAQFISEASGQTITYLDFDRDQWVKGVVASGIPESYGEVLRNLTATIAEGRGARPNDVVLSVTGKVPTTFANFARREAKAWMPESAS